MKIFRTLSLASRLIFMVALFVVLAPVTSFASRSCDFIRDLDLEDVGDDVKCLQEYLNGAGFTISSSGVGSPGRETTQFKALTKKAVISWQTSNGLPASGFFGPLSRQKYSEVAGNVANSISLASTAAEIEAKIAAAKAKLAEVANNDQTPTPVVSSVSESGAQKAIEDALEKIYKAQDQIEDAKGDGQNITEATKDIERSREFFFEAITAYFDRNFSEVVKLTDKSDRYSDDAIESAGGKTDEDEIEDYLDEVQDEIDRAENQIESADDDGKDVSEAEELLEEAKDLLEQANDKFDDRDFDSAEDLAKDAENKAEDAIDSIGDTSKNEAKVAIEKAEDAIDDAQDQIDESDDDDDIREAEELLSQADDELNRARKYYRDGRYDDAVDSAEEAEDLARDAKNKV